MFFKNNIFISILAGTVPALITVGYKFFGPLIFFNPVFIPEKISHIDIKHALHRGNRLRDWGHLL